VKLPRHRKTAVLEGVRPQILEFCVRNGLYVTSARDGHHNEESKHPLGEAADFRTIGMSEEFFQHLVRDALEHRLRVRDERKRPKNQKVWSGPHGHVETL
jgi:hypothetical protein